MLPYGATVFEASQVSRPIAQLVMRVLQTQRLLAPDEPNQHICRINPCSEKFDVGATVRNTSDDDVGIQDLGGELGSLPPLGLGDELRCQVFLNHHVEYR